MGVADALPHAVDPLANSSICHARPNVEDRLECRRLELFEWRGHELLKGSNAQTQALERVVAAQRSRTATAAGCRWRRFGRHQALLSCAS
jgi:hypothetical protein